MADSGATPARATVQVDNERVKVTEWRFAPGAETGWHRHAYDYVVVPMTTGKLKLFDGKQNSFRRFGGRAVLLPPHRRRAQRHQRQRLRVHVRRGGVQDAALSAARRLVSAEIDLICAP